MFWKLSAQLEHKILKIESIFAQCGIAVGDVICGWSPKLFVQPSLSVTNVRIQIFCFISVITILKVSIDDGGQLPRTYVAKTKKGWLYSQVGVEVG